MLDTRVALESHISGIQGYTAKYRYRVMLHDIRNGEVVTLQTDDLFSLFKTLNLLDKVFYCENNAGRVVRINMYFLYRIMKPRPLWREAKCYNSYAELVVEVERIKNLD